MISRFINKISDFRCKRIIKKFIIELYSIKGLDILVYEVFVNEYGFVCKMDLNFKYCFSDLEKHLEFIKDNIKAYSVELNKIGTDIYLTVYTEFLEDLYYKFCELSEYELLLGYNYQGNIIVDMRITPHLLICGLSGQGKTQMVKTIINNLRGADVVLINAFRHDFKEYRGRFINGIDKIKVFLNGIFLNEEVRQRPLFVVFDELLVLSKDKEIIKLITDLLAIARHKNIFIVGISQVGTKEQLKFKDLFNARVCFRSIEESSYRTVLGCSVSEGLLYREFYLYSDGIYKGKTFLNRN